ncbi:MAG: competence/damage-inducible protein A [Acidimicrobiales bacterium]|jgi:nicotinamide-nucleotide amidase
MRAEVVAVGTELVLGQVVDTNSAWIGEQLAMSGIDCNFQTRVGDNIDRIASALRLALGRNEAVIVCGGLGPTQDDVTREAIASVMNVPLCRDATVLQIVRERFVPRGPTRTMPANNERQADVPEGATVIPQTMGTAPGLICPVGDKVMYALPGVPYEMQDMMRRAVLPDLERRSGQVAVIRSRTLRTWGLSESGLAELVAPRVEALEDGGPGVPTIAFLASGVEGIKLRLTVKAADRDSADKALDAEEAELRILVGDSVFGVDDETMEHVVGGLLLERGWTLGIAESLTGGLLAARVVGVPGASEWFRGAVVAYDAAVKQSVLGVPEGPVVTRDAAVAMAEGARRVLHADVGLATTGVAGPTEQEGRRVGTVVVGLALPGSVSEAVEFRLPGERERVRQLATISAFNLLRRRLSAADGEAQGP